MSIWRAAIQIEGGALPDPGVNIFHARVGEVVDADIDIALDNVEAGLQAFYNEIKGLYPNDVTISHDGVWQEIATPEPRQHDQGSGFSVGGTGTSDTLPAFVCMTVTWLTALSNRRGRGRSFIGPLVQSTAEANGTPEEANRSVLSIAAANLVDLSDNTEPVPWALGVWSPTDNVLRDFTGSRVPNKFASLRSRRD